jgi:putative flippase GtrA
VQPLAHPMHTVMMHTAIRWRPLRFSLVGALGFLVDAGVLHLLVFEWHANLFAARVVSFIAAVFATWLTNRTTTFGSGANSAGALFVEWLRYLLSSIVGGATNYAVFVIMVQLFTSVRNSPTIGVAVGSIAGMCMNYVLYSEFVFSSRPGG